MARDALNQKQQRDVRSFSIRFKAPYFRYRSRLCRSDYTADSCVFSSRVNDARRDNENHCSNSEIIVLAAPSGKINLRHIDIQRMVKQHKIEKSRSSATNIFCEM